MNRLTIYSIIAVILLIPLGYMMSEYVISPIYSDSKVDCTALYYPVNASPDQKTKICAELQLSYDDIPNESRVFLMVIMPSVIAFFLFVVFKIQTLGYVNTQRSNS
jgi:hypothetical protein